MILLNKGDLVKEEQHKDLLEKIEILNPKAKIVKSIHSKIDVMEILNTSLYKDKEEFWVTSTKHEINAHEDAAKEKTHEAEKKKLLKRVPDACTARFDIASFVYRAR